MSENIQNLENTEKVEKELTSEEKLTEKLAQAEEKYKYLYAEFENFKKRASKERTDALKFGWENIAEELLQVLDNFERALQYAKPETDPNLISGLQMVSQQFLNTLGKQGISVIPSLGQPFNPELHESIGQKTNDQPVNTIIEEVQKGYTLHGRLLRASRVILSSGPASI